MSLPASQFLRHHSSGGATNLTASAGCGAAVKRTKQNSDCAETGRTHLLFIVHRRARLIAMSGATTARPRTAALPPLLAPEKIMSPHQARIVQSTWPKILPNKDAAAQLFYARLFELDPSLKPMFLGDIRQQGRKLMLVLDSVVNGLADIGTIAAAVRDLGMRHVGYGVREHHYDTVGAALLWAIERGLGAAFTAEVHDAWAAAYRMLAAIMRGAAADVVAGRLSAEQAQ
jgi:hemoglobin-like flavoprotein